MSISPKEVLHLADLSKLSFSENEVEKLVNEFDSIIAFANTINDTVDGYTDELHSINNRTVDYSNLREDVVEDSLSNETILSNVEGNNGFFTAKRCVKWEI